MANLLMDEVRIVVGKLPGQAVGHLADDLVGVNSVAIPAPYGLTMNCSASSPRLATIQGVAWSSVSLPTVIGEHVIATKDGVDYRIACAGSGRWTVSARGEGRKVIGALEATGDTYTFAQLGDRAVAGSDWRKLIA